MRKFLFAVLFVLGCGATGFGQQPVTKSYGYTTYMSTSSAQGVAELQAKAGQCRHFGGNSGYEGVGYSSSSADAAIRNCCYWGQRKPREIGVARGARGWFACVRYH